MNSENKIDIIKGIEDIKEFISNLKKRQSELREGLSNADKEISDIKHAAEFFTLNASQGYKLYKMLHDACNRRREYKDELQDIEIILANLSGPNDILKIESRLEKSKHKRYRPRVLKELFNC